MALFALFLTHWFQYNFAPTGHAWYEGAVWPNLFVVLPLAILGTAGVVYHHFVLKRFHEGHARDLGRIMGVLAEGNTEAKLDRIAALVDATQPGGVTVILDEIRKEKASSRKDEASSQNA
jgi:hypothetical protein